MSESTTSPDLPAPWWEVYIDGKFVSRHDDEASAIAASQQHTGEAFVSKVVSLTGEDAARALAEGRTPVERAGVFGSSAQIGHQLDNG